MMVARLEDIPRLPILLRALGGYAACSRLRHLTRLSCLARTDCGSALIGHNLVPTHPEKQDAACYLPPARRRAASTTRPLTFHQDTFALQVVRGRC